MLPRLAWTETGPPAEPNLSLAMVADLAVVESRDHIVTLITSGLDHYHDARRPERWEIESLRGAGSVVYTSMRAPSTDVDA